ncbi:MAG: UBA/ThiF-type NAD/FAD binding fold:MoeZ/MoeB [uncultured bacterium]|nr:MAG: UBA/ThiF-type NAD/FAD binding fold:MoeZ/MoeB [uncultured bacterium]
MIDSDNVSLSNLQRQILYCSGDIHKKKVFSAQLKLSKLNSDVTIDCYHQRLSNDNAHEYISKYDFILDCTDNFESKYLIAEKCKFYNKPYSHGAILKFAGQTLTVIPGKTACYRCVFPDMPEQQTARNCSKAGVMGVVPGIIGTIQATEAIKYFLKLGNLLTDQLLTYDALNMEFRKVPVSKQRDCFLCN